MGGFSNNVNQWENGDFFFKIRMHTGNGGMHLSFVLSSNQGGRELTSPEQVLSDTLKIRNCYILGAEIKIK
jgi:hypothetical protein